MTDEPDQDAARQKVVRVPGSRRAKLTPVPGTDADPETAAPVVRKPAASARRGAEGPKGPKGPNDDRMMQDVPPHY